MSEAEPRALRATSEPPDDVGSPGVPIPPLAVVLSRIARREQRRARIRRRRIAIALVLLLAGLLVAWVVGPTNHPTPVSASQREVVVNSHLPATRRVAGTLGALPWPAKGQGAVAVLGTGVMAHSLRTPTVPIASLTKMMTAYLTMTDHPLVEGEEGPTLTMSAADVADYVHADETDESNVPVRLGEQLTEQQLLEALLIPSADNVADLLAIWDAGSIPAFVAKMNRTAEELGLGATHYADASGVNPGSRSDAPDQALLAAALMRYPVIRAIVSKPSLAFPVAGTIWNYNPGLGTDGIIGVKSGFTSQASGCLATAAYRAVDGRHVLVVAVSLGQPAGLYEAAQVDEGLLDAAGRSLVEFTVPLPASGIGDLVLGGTTAPLGLVGPMPRLVGWPGLQLSERLQALGPTGPPNVATVANLVISSPVGVLASVPLTTTRPFSATTTSSTTTSTVPASTAPTTTLPSSTASTVPGSSSTSTASTATSSPVGTSSTTTPAAG